MEEEQPSLETPIYTLAIVLVIQDQRPGRPLKRGSFHLKMDHSVAPRHGRRFIDHAFAII